MDDLISRQQAIGEAERWLYDGDDKRTIGEMLRDLPSVQLERKTGQWIPDTDSYYEKRFFCSVCRRSYKVDTCMGKPIWDFCPCGADMRGGEDA